MLKVLVFVISDGKLLDSSLSKFTWGFVMDQDELEFVIAVPDHKKGKMMVLTHLFKKSFSLLLEKVSQVM